MCRPTWRYRLLYRARTAPCPRPGPVTEDDLVLRCATIADLGATAQLHVEQLPAGFFPGLGPRFMRRWHRTYLDSPHGVALVAVCRCDARGHVCGFLFGSIDEAAHMRAVLADRRCLLVLAAVAAVSLLRHPSLAVRFVRTRARPWTRRLLGTLTYQTAAPPAGTDSAPVAVLAAVTVRPSLRGSGVGARLVELFLSHAHEGGCATAELFTSAGSDGAGAFYERLGWSPGSEYRTRDGDMVRSYRHPVVPPARHGTFCDKGGADPR